MIDVYIGGHIVPMPVEDYLNIKAMELGFNNYEEMKKYGLVIKGYENK